MPALSVRAQAALAGQAEHLRTDDGRLLVWAFFEARDPGAAALAEAAAALHPRVRDRRARQRGPGAPLVDAGDLPVSAAALDAARATGARLRRTSRWLHAASFAATDSQVLRLAALPRVVAVDLVARVRRAPPAPPGPPPRAKSAAGDWSDDYGASAQVAELLRVPQAHAMGLTGRGVVVGLLDSGFRTTHEALRHLPVLGTRDFVDDDDVVDFEDGDPANTHSHGTQVLGNLAGYRQARLISPGWGVSVLLARTEFTGDETPSEEDDWVAGLEWLEAQGADLVSSSLSYYEWYDAWDFDGDTPVITRAADAAAARGLLVVTSAGNYRHTIGTIAAPADGDSVLAVGATDAAGALASFSSPGPTADGRIKPEVTAPGVTNPTVNPNHDRDYGASTGTSFSCPLVSGVAALVLERAPGLRPMQLREALMMTATGADHPDNDFGWGLVQADRAARWFGPLWSHAPVLAHEDTAAAVPVRAVISARLGLAATAPRVVWRADGGPWRSAPLSPAPGFPTTWAGAIPAQPAGTVVDYYLTAADAAGVVVTEPVRGQRRHLTFTVGADTTAPALDHRPVGDQTTVSWPPVVTCTTSDDAVGVDLRFRLNGGAEQGPYALGNGDPERWTLRFPLSADALAPGDVVSYTLTAYDGAAAPNARTRGPWPVAYRSVDARDTTLVDLTARAVPDDGGTGGTFGHVELAPAPGDPVWRVSVGVDIAHPDPSQLRVELISPSGTRVRLHDHGAGGPDLVGDWPATLTVAGPGALDDLVGEPSGGLWMLTVHDDVPGGTGTLNAWQLDLTFTEAVSSAGGDVPGARTALLPAVPNPFNPRTALRFTLARAGRTRLSVYDVRGMLVRDLLDAALAVGPHRVVWDGRDRAGREVGSGVYLYRLTTPDGAVRQRKMTLLR